MDFKVEIYQRESIEFLIPLNPPIDYSNNYLNIIVKNTDDNENNNLKALINKTILLDSNNLSNEDFINVQNGILKITLDSEETNIDNTDYKVMIQITSSDNSVAKVLSFGSLKIKDNYLKR